jgi:hypothetical protein
LIISSRISSSARFLLCGSIVSAKYRYFQLIQLWNNTGGNSISNDKKSITKI